MAEQRRNTCVHQCRRGRRQRVHGEAPRLAGVGLSTVDVAVVGGVDGSPAGLSSKCAAGLAYEGFDVEPGMGDGVEVDQVGVVAPDKAEEVEDGLLAECVEPGWIGRYPGPVSYRIFEVGRGSCENNFPVSRGRSVQVHLNPTKTIAITEPILLVTINVANEQRLVSYTNWDLSCDLVCS